MHILILPSWYSYSSRPLGGVFFREQALALRDAGYQIGVVAPILKSLKEFSGPREFSRNTRYWINDGGVATLREESWAIPKLHRLNMARWLSSGRRLVNEYFESQGRPDIIHAHSMLYAGSLAAEIKEKHQISYVITEHSSVFARGLINDWQLRHIQKAIHNSSCRVAVSEELARLLGRFTPVPGATWNYLPNMVDVDFFSAGHDMESTAANTRFVFFFAAFLTQNKGAHVLLEAFARSFADDEVELWIGGDGEERARLEKQATFLGIRNRTRFLGNLTREQMRITMRQCDAFVLPSLHETFGVVLIEALATGKPVIATRCGGPESIVHSKNGFLVAPSDPDALGAAMRQMVKTVDRFDTDAIRSDCIERFSRQAVVRELSKVYRAALDGPR